MFQFDRDNQEGKKDVGQFFAELAALRRSIEAGDGDAAKGFSTSPKSSPRSLAWERLTASHH